MSDDPFDNGADDGLAPPDLSEAPLAAPMLPPAPPELAYCARWRAPLTAFGVIEVTLRMIQSRPGPFVLVSLFAAVLSVGSNIAGEAIFGPPDPSGVAFWREIFALNTLPHRLLMPIVDGMAIVLAVNLYYGPGRPLGESTHLLMSAFPVFLLVCMLERLIDDVAMALFFVPMLFVAGRIAFASAQVMLERMPVLTSFRVSWQRTRPIQWLAFRLTLAVFACAMGMETAAALATAPLGQDALHAMNTYVMSFFYAPLMVLFSIAYCWLYFEHQMGWLDPGNRPRA